MQLGKRLRAAPVVLLLGCGPSVTPASDWMIGWFSDALPEFPLSHDSGTNYQLLDDHTVEVEEFRECGGQVAEWTMTWEEDGESAVRLLANESTPSSFGENFDGYRINRLPGCDGFEIFVVIGGEVLDYATQLHHARLCMTNLGEDPECNGGDCNRCYKEWCEGLEPTACVD